MRLGQIFSVTSCICSKTSLTRSTAMLPFCDSMFLAHASTLPTIQTSIDSKTPSSRSVFSKFYFVQASPILQITVRWENVCAQVEERLHSAEEAQQTQMIYRSQYDEEIQWLDRVERTINSLRRPEDMRPEELQAQLDQLVQISFRSVHLFIFRLAHEYAQLQEHTSTIENINREGGKFIRGARVRCL